MVKRRMRVRGRRSRKGNGKFSGQTSVIFQTINGTFGTSGGMAVYDAASTVVDKTLTCRPSSFTIDVLANTTGTVMYVTAKVNDNEVFHSRDFIAAPGTARRVKLKVPRNVDYGSKCTWNIHSSGAGVIAGSAGFTYKNPLSTAQTITTGFTPRMNDANASSIDSVQNSNVNLSA